MASYSVTNAQVDPYLRIRADKVTELLDLVGELGLAVSGVTHHPSLVGLEINGFETASHRLEMLVRETQDMVSALRLVPVGQVFHRMERVVRDLSHQTGKEISLITEGEDVEIDKAIVDQIGDPLMHLIRNSADHGLEIPDERERIGKNRKGTIRLIAAQHGREIHITVSDDGRGLNRDAILKRAYEKGLLREGSNLSDQEIWNCIFQSGFSTVKEISNLSGRGVGMDVVKNTINALRGRIEINTREGQGTDIKLIIPLTLAFFESMVIRKQNCLYTLPIDAVNEVLQLTPEEIIFTPNNEKLIMRQGVAIPLPELLDDVPGLQSDGKMIVIVQSLQGSIGLIIDEVIGQQQVVMKPLTGHLRDIRGGTGCALLSSGEVAIALDAELLLLNETARETSNFPG